MAILEVQHIEKHFGATKVLEDISFSLEKGQALSIIGSSGSGKSTLIQHLNGLLKPSSGQVLFDGEDIWKDKAFTRQIRLILVHLAATRLTRVSGSLFGSLSVTKIPVPYTIVSVCSYSDRFSM